MTNDLTPDGIKQRAYDARVSINKLMKRAGVSNSTLWRWKHEDRTPHPITLGKVVDALEAFEAERMT
jgi:predicted DNA-binding transcriptional regulator AlpA